MPNEILVTVDEKKAISLLKTLDKKKVHEFFEVVQRAYQPGPKKKDLNELQQWLNNYPAIWSIVFDVGQVIENNLIKRMVSDQVAQKAVEKNANEIRLDLGYESTSTMERLLINNIVVSWLRLQWLEYQLIGFMGQGEVRMSVVEYWERRLSGAQRRYLRASEALTRIRRLMLAKPAVQVNIAGEGGQQVNVAGDLGKK